MQARGLASGLGVWERVNTGPETEEAVMSLIRRHPVITFFLLAYALCWAAIPWQSFFAPGVRWRR